MQIPEQYVYDLETYPNVFTATFVRVSDQAVWQFVVFDDPVHGCNHSLQILEMVQFLRNVQAEGIGFNNIGFDYPILHKLMLQGRVHGFTAQMAYGLAMNIINAQESQRFANLVWESDWMFPQVDLFKIHHFDNRARRTSLKMIEFNRRSRNVSDLPFPVGTNLTREQIPVLLEYNLHDCMETLEFLRETEPMIEFRRKLTTRYGKNFINHNDTKIGKDYFIMQLEEHSPGSCYDYSTGRRIVRQTKRDQVALRDIIFPYIQFNHYEFQRVHQLLASKVIRNEQFDDLSKNDTTESDEGEFLVTKGIFTDIQCTVDGFTYYFGTGGIHGSVSSQVVRSTDDWVIVDLDVTSYYPSLAICNRLYPQHLGERFCDIYKSMKDERTGYPKSAPENAMLKLALNGVYGDSNNKYSPFYDPAYMLSITINGQLLLCMLSELIRDNVVGATVVQINTDGITVKIPRESKELLDQAARTWMMVTGLELEEAIYEAMFIRDVNNYIAVKPGGETKRKGAYQLKRDLAWHQNHSATIVREAAFSHLVYGVSYEEYIRSHPNIFDFFLRVKASGGHKIMWGDEQMPRITRYYVSTAGRPLQKIMPAAGPVGQYKKANGVSQRDYDAWHHAWGNTHNPEVHTKNQSVYGNRTTDIEAGFTVQVCNDIRGITEFPDINYNYYIAETEKLIRPFL